MESDRELERLEIVATTLARVGSWWKRIACGSWWRTKCRNRSRPIVRTPLVEGRGRTLSLARGEPASNEAYEPTRGTLGHEFLPKEQPVTFPSLCSSADRSSRENRSRNRFGFLSMNSWVRFRASLRHFEPVIFQVFVSSRFRSLNFFRFDTFGILNFFNRICVCWIICTFELIFISPLNYAYRISATKYVLDLVRIDGIILWCILIIEFFCTFEINISSFHYSNCAKDFSSKRIKSFTL